MRLLHEPPKPFLRCHSNFYIETSMASADLLLSDPLNRLRDSIASNNPPIPTSSAESTSASDVDLSLAVATHLFFPTPTPQSFSLDTPTRFVSSNKPVDLRSIYFAWLKKDVAIPDYIASAQRLSEELSAAGQGGKVQNLVFVERLDLITWLEGASEESEYIQPLVTDPTAAQTSGQSLATSGSASGITPTVAGVASRGGKAINPRLALIYNGERKMGDRNCILRGIKPTVSIVLVYYLRILLRRRANLEP
jgi:parafibromin